MARTGRFRTANASLQQQSLDLLLGQTSSAGFSILRSIFCSDAAHSTEPRAPAGEPNGTPAYGWNAASPWAGRDQLRLGSADFGFSCSAG